MNMRTTFFHALLFISCTIAADSPDHSHELSEEYLLLGTHFEQVGKAEKAAELYTKAVSLDSENPRALTRLGVIYCAQKKTDEAIQVLEHALELQHEDPTLHFTLGQCYQQKDDWSNAATQYKRTIELDPNNLNAHLYAGTAYEKTNQIVSAITAFHHATRLDPAAFEAWHQLGNLYRHIERLEDAITPYRKAMELQPHNAHVIMDLANALNMLNCNEEALELYKVIVEANPGAISALYNFGFTLKKMGKIEEALKIYEQVLPKKPDYAPVHFSLASIYLTLGDYEKGLPEYEWRWKAYNQNDHTDDIPLWNGESLSGRTLLVCAEQGLGDTIQFVRYLKFLKVKYPTAHLIIETQSALAHLLRLQPYIDHVIARHTQRPACDYQIPLMSIPLRVQTRLETIPADIPYLQADGSRLAFWKERLSQDTNFKIGICWQGNARYSTLALRKAVAAKSLALQSLKPLTELQGISIYCLQKIDGLNQITECDFKDKLIMFDEAFDTQHGSFMDSAAVMQQLDLVISVDTAPCHLAAAQGVPTWILLPFPADWRWLRDRSDTPWYPSVRLFRQPALGDWDTPITEMMSALQQTISGNTHETTQASEPHKTTPEQQRFFEQLMQQLD